MYVLCIYQKAGKASGRHECVGAERKGAWAMYLVVGTDTSTDYSMICDCRDFLHARADLDLAWRTSYHFDFVTSYRLEAYCSNRQNRNNAGNLICQTR